MKRRRQSEDVVSSDSDPRDVPCVSHKRHRESREDVVRASEDNPSGAREQVAPISEAQTTDLDRDHRASRVDGGGADAKRKNTSALLPDRMSRLARIRIQIEFYLGDSNVRKDKFVRELLLKGAASEDIADPEFAGNWIPVDDFITFGRLRAMKADEEDVVRAVKRSRLLEVSKDKPPSIRRRNPLPKEDDKSWSDRTLWVGSLPLSLLDGEVSAQRIEGGSSAMHAMIAVLFSACGEVTHVSLPRFPDSRKFRGFAFVEFSSPDAMLRAKEMAAESTWGDLISRTRPSKLQDLATPEGKEASSAPVTKTWSEWDEARQAARRKALPQTRDRRGPRRMRKDDREDGPHHEKMDAAARIDIKRPSERVIFRIAGLCGQNNAISLKLWFLQFVSSIAYVDLRSPAASEAYIRLYNSKIADYLEHCLEMIRAERFLFIGEAKVEVTRLSQVEEAEYWLQAQGSVRTATRESRQCDNEAAADKKMD